ncbi:MAG: ABC transporter ATP-binding protein [Lachnospiraceae bacterium]|nr:ABC transporter ATP-binding protein [Lachnospiraceae bacterium]
MFFRTFLERDIAVEGKAVESMVKLETVTKKVEGFSLKEISMEIPGGYICGLIGPNGAGKTTLLHLIMGLLKPDEGSVSIFGKNFSEEEAAIHDDMGVVLQERLFDSYLSLKENGAYYGRFYSRYEEVYFLELLQKYGLEPGRKYKALSKGEELKFQFAFALSHHPRLLLLDEPTGNFDPEFREEFLTDLKEFISDGERSVILATHLTDDLDRMADYITYLEDGKMLLSQNIEELREGYRMLRGEAYKIKLLPQENIIYMEQGEFGAKALIEHRRRFQYDAALTVSYPTIEELMYCMTKRRKGGKRC